MRRSLCGTVSVTLASLQTVLRLPAKRWAALNDELHEPDSQLARLTKKTAARLLARFGIGPYTTATLLIIKATIQLGYTARQHWRRFAESAFFKHRLGRVIATGSIVAEIARPTMRCGPL